MKKKREYEIKKKELELKEKNLNLKEKELEFFARTYGIRGNTNHLVESQPEEIQTPKYVPSPVKAFLFFTINIALIIIILIFSFLIYIKGDFKITKIVTEVYIIPILISVILLLITSKLSLKAAKHVLSYGLSFMMILILIFSFAFYLITIIVLMPIICMWLFIKIVIKNND